MGLMKKTSSRGKPVVLRGEKLRTLAKLVYYQEVNHIKANPFKSEYNRGRQLRESREAYNYALSLTQLSSEFYESKSEPNPNPEPEPEPELGSEGGEDHEVDQAKVAMSLKDYLEYAVGYALGCVQNINLRKEYLAKVKAHAEELKGEVRAFSELSKNKAKELFDRLQTFKITTYQAIVKKADKPYRVLSRLSRPSLKNFSHTLRIVQRRLTLERSFTHGNHFNELTLQQKQQVTEEMLESMVLEKDIMKRVLPYIKGVGISVMLATAVMVTYNAVTAEGGAYDKVEVLVKDVANLGIGYYVGGLAETATVWAATTILGTALLESSALVALGVGLGAIGVGFAVAYFAAPVVAKAVDWVCHHMRTFFEKLFGIEEKKNKEDNHSQQTHKVPPLTASNLHVLVATMPDGATLAHRVAYQGGAS